MHKPAAQYSLESQYATVRLGNLEYSREDSIEVANLITQGDAAGREQVLDSAIPFYQSAYELSVKTGYLNGVLHALYGIGGVHLRQSRLDNALKQYQKALWYYRKGNQRQITDRTLLNTLSSIYGNMATLYYFKADYHLTAAYFDSCLQVNEYIKGDEHARVNTLINLGAVYIRLRQPATALRYLEQGEAICRAKSYLSLLMPALNNKGEAYLMLKQDEQAMHCFREQLEIADSARHSIGLISAYASIGDVLLRQGKPREALSYLGKAENMLDPSNPYQSFLDVRKLLGFAYFQLKDYPRAEQQLNEVLAHAESLEIRDELPHIHKTLVQLYEATGGYRKALYHQQQLAQLNDSIFNKERVNEVNELEVRYRTAEKDHLLQQERASLREKETRLRAQKFLMAGVISGALLIIAVLILLYRNARHRQKVISKEEETKHLHAMIEGEEKERSRISRELHDGIGGMLASVKMNLSAVNKAYPSFEGKMQLEHIAHMLGETTAEVRRMAHNLIPDVLTKHSLEQALDMYCSDINNTNQLQVYVQCHGIAGALSKATELMCYRIVQELLQNIMKHAQAAHASVQIMLAAGTLGIIVEDDGDGFDPDEQRRYTGVGLDNLRFRVKSLQGTMELLSQEGKGTTVHILFDVHKLARDA